MPGRPVPTVPKHIYAQTTVLCYWSETRGMFIPPCPKCAEIFFSGDSIMSKFRNYSIVIHNVLPIDEQYWKNIVSSLSPRRSVVSMEPYPSGLGFHYHIFLEFDNARHKMSLLKAFQSVQTGHIDTETDKTEGQKGRIQVDKMLGSFAQATAYLTQDLTKKDKVCGVPIITNHKTLTCKKCGITKGETIRWFQENYSDGSVLCHTCCLDRDIRSELQRQPSLSMEDMLAYDPLKDFNPNLRDLEKFCAMQSRKLNYLFSAPV